MAPGSGYILSKDVKQNILQYLWHSHKIKLASKILSKLNFRNCLDVGCASGYMISELQVFWD